MPIKKSKANLEENVNVTQGTNEGSNNSGQLSGEGAGSQPDNDKTSAAIPQTSVTEVNLGAEIHSQTSPASQTPMDAVTEAPHESAGEETADQNNSTSTEGVGFSTVAGIADNLAGDDVFNPAIHCVDENGLPKKTKTGKYRRKPGRKNSESVKVDRIEGSNKFNETPNPELLGMISTTLKVLSGIAAAAIGPQWALSDSEQSTLADVYARYIHYRGWDDVITPEAVVISVTATVFLPRLLPLFLSMMGMGGISGAVKNAHANSWPVGVGKNNAGENSGNASGIGREVGDNLRPITIIGLGTQT